MRPDVSSEAQNGLNCWSLCRNKRLGGAGTAAVPTRVAAADPDSSPSSSWIYGAAVGAAEREAALARGGVRRDAGSLVQISVGLPRCNSRVSDSGGRQDWCGDGWCHCLPEQERAVLIQSSPVNYTGPCSLIIPTAAWRFIFRLSVTQLHLRV